MNNQLLTGLYHDNIINQTLVLEEGDAIKMTAGTADELQGIISYAQIDRSQENG
jgi:hypothetical protein